jgi:hypothetical protein
VRVTYLGPSTASSTQLDLDDDFQEELRGTLDIQARLLYGLIHARWIVTARGLAKMVRPTPTSNLPIEIS